MEISHLKGIEDRPMADITVSTKLIDAPRMKAHVYRLKAPRFSEAAVRKFAKQFGLRAERNSGKLSTDAEKLVYTDGHHEVMLHKASGAVRMVDRSKWQVDDRSSDLRIQDAAALKLAEGAVRQMKLARAGEMRFYKAARLRVGVATRQGREVSERTIDVAVAMQRVVDKIPVDGPGGKIIVYLNHERRLTGIERVWRELGAAHRRNAPCRSAEAALDDMRKHFRAKEGTIDIYEVRYGYFEDGRRRVQRYLQPAYMFFGLIGTPGSRVRKRTVYVASALEHPVEAITPPLGRKRQQKARPASRGRGRGAA
jgi:hypothetical protein